jgi:hypothetical protein
LQAFAEVIGLRIASQFIRPLTLVFIATGIQTIWTGI